MKNKSINSADNIQANIDEITQSIGQLIIKQNKLKKALLDIERSNQSEVRRSTQTRVKIPKNNDLKIGDTVRITSKHKGRYGKIGKITGYKGTTQYKVDIVLTSSTEAEIAAREHSLKKESISVWKSNVKHIDYKKLLQHK